MCWHPSGCRMKLQCVILLLKHITMALAMLIYNKLNTSPQPPFLISDRDRASLGVGIFKVSSITHTIRYFLNIMGPKWLIHGADIFQETGINQVSRWIRWNYVSRQASEDVNDRVRFLKGFPNRPWSFTMMFLRTWTFSSLSINVQKWLQRMCIHSMKG